jgi:hypothetical protein
MRLTEFAKHMFPVLINPLGTEVSPVVPESDEPIRPSDKSFPKSISVDRPAAPQAGPAAAAAAYPLGRGLLLAEETDGG